MGHSSAGLSEVWVTLCGLAPEAGEDNSLWVGQETEAEGGTVPHDLQTPIMAGLKLSWARKRASSAVVTDSQSAGHPDAGGGGRVLRVSICLHIETEPRKQQHSIAPRWHGKRISLRVGLKICRVSTTLLRQNSLFKLHARGLLKSEVTAQSAIVLTCAQIHSHPNTRIHAHTARSAGSDTL